MVRPNIFDSILGRFLIFCENKIFHILPKQYLEQFDMCPLFIKHWHSSSRHHWILIAQNLERALQWSRKRENDIFKQQLFYNSWKYIKIKLTLLHILWKEPTFVETKFRAYLNSWIPNYFKTAKYNGCVLLISVIVVHGKKTLNFVASLNHRLVKPRNSVSHENQSISLFIIPNKIYLFLIH